MSGRPRSQGNLGSLGSALVPVELLSPTRTFFKTSNGIGRPSSSSSTRALPKEIPKVNGLRLRKAIPSASDSRLATSTRLQNSLKKKYAERLQTVFGSESPGSEEGEEAELLNEDVFTDGVAQLAHNIEDLAKLIRFDHLMKRDTTMSKLEAARREKEAELRRARKKEQMAKDPRRKVNLKLERGRRERQEMEETMAKVAPADMPRRLSEDIPLLPFHSEECGPGNQEPSTIVDVKKIQRSCESLGHHQSASDLLDLRRKERRARPKHVKRQSRDWLHGLLDGFTLEDRLSRVKSRRDDLTAEKMQRRLDNMRSECPAYLCRAWGSSQAGGPGSWDTDSDSDLELEDRRGSFSSNRSNRSNRSEEKLFAGGRKSKRFTTRGTNSLSPASIGLGKGTRRSTVRPGSARLVEMERLRLERTQKLRRCRMAMRACVQWLKIFFKRRRRDTAADICLVLLKQLGEWVRMRGALKQFVNNVKTIQHTVREYLAMKRRRCYLIEKEWCRVEDSHLSVHAQYHAQKAMQAEDQQKGSKVKSKRRILQAALQASVSSKWKLVVDFNNLRIPVAERRAVIAAYHKRAMKRHMHIGKTFLQLVFDALRAGRELDNFLKQFHYDNDAKSVVEGLISKEDIAERERKEKEELLYWQMPEAMIVKLVACCAQGLANVEAFKEHPANQAVPKEKRNVWPEYVVGSDPYEFADFIMLRMDRPVYRGRFARNPALRTQDILFEEERRIANGARDTKLQPSRLSPPPGNESPALEEPNEGEVEIKDVDQALANFRPNLTIRKDRKLRSWGSMNFSSSLSSTSASKDEGADFATNGIDG